MSSFMPRPRQTQPLHSAAGILVRRLDWVLSQVCIAFEAMVQTPHAHLGQAARQGQGLRAWVLHLALRWYVLFHPRACLAVEKMGP